MIDNRDLSLYLMDGTYEGCIRYEYDGYNLVAYKIPRDDFSRIKNDPESGILSNSSIYLLFGKKDNQPTVYVGQAAARKNGNAALQRIPEPHGDKDWVDAVILTTNDDHLDRSALCYLENLFYRMIKEAGSYIITNSAEPSSDNSIKQKDIRILAKYVEHATILVQIMGFNAFKKKVETSKLEKPTNRIIPDTIDTETDRIGSQICRMVEEKNEILTEKMKDESKQQRMESMLKLLEDEPDGFTEYDDSLVRSFIERITVLDCTLMVRFKSGIEIEVAA